MKGKRRLAAASFLGCLSAVWALGAVAGWPGSLEGQSRLWEDGREERGSGQGLENGIKHRKTEGLTLDKQTPSLRLSVSRNAPVYVTAPEDYQNIAISQVSDYVNIRSGPSTSGTVVGKIYNNCAATILQSVQGEGGLWYQIRSGSVEGYIKAQYFITGAQAEAVAKEIGVQYATVNTASLRLRAEASLSSAILTTLPQGAEYVVLGETNNFAHLSIDEDLEGYASLDYIKTRIEFNQAVSLEEEAAKLEEDARRKAEAAVALQNLEEIRMVEAQGGSVNHTSQQAGNPGGDNLQNGISTVPPEAPSSGGASSQGLPGQNPSSGGASGQGLSGQNPSSGGISGQGAQGGNLSGGNGTAGSAQRQGEVPIIAANPLGQGDDPRVSAPDPGPVSSGSAENNGTEPGSVTYGPGGNASSAVISATRTALVAYAKQFLGNPYVYGGSSLTEGTDCSGFVMRIYEHFGIQTGRNSREQAANGRQIAIEAVQPGDLLFYASGNTINHVAIYIGGGQVIHAASAKTGIIISPSNYRTPCKAVTFLQ